MTSIHKYSSIENSELCHPAHSVDFDIFSDMVNGFTRSKEWEPIEVEIIHEDESGKLCYSDAPWLGSHAPIFRRRTLSLLEDLLRGHGEFLPLACEEEDLYVFNVTRLINALDVQNSTVSRFSSGKLMRITQYSFHEDRLHGAVLFKIPDLRVSPVFCSQIFVDSWRSAGFTGLDFPLIWRSPTG